MVYAAYGVSGLTGIVGTFFVKDYLEVSPAFLAALAFWAGIPWALKMPVGHVVDLIWRWKAALVWLGASMIAASLLIMIGLISYPEAMRAVMSPVRWFVLAALLAPTGYMIQDAVADAMTVEAVPRVDETGKPYDAQTLKSMHTTMQTLGRVAVIGGLALVAAANIYIFAGTEDLPKERKAELYANVYTAALIIPVISVLGVVLHRFLKHEREAVEKTRPNWAVLGGSLVFVAITLAVGFGGLPYAQELVFLGSLGIILFLLWRLARELAPEARQVLVATALVLFVYRSMPLTGDGSTWWMIDVLKFNEGFLAQLSLVTYTLTLVGMFVLRRFMAEHSIATIVVVLLRRGRDPVGADHRHVLRAARMDRGAHRRRGRRPLHRAHQHRARVAARPDRDDPDARLDRQLRAGAPQGHLLRGHGVVLQPRARRLPARHGVPQRGVRREARRLQRAWHPHDRRHADRARAAAHHGGRRAAARPAHCLKMK